MKPEFALLLSFDGIALLHRGAGGWRRVGAVNPHSETLAEDLKALRKKGEQLAETALHTKLVIPPEQIRYLTIETGRLRNAARLDKAAQALEGATPYAVNELAFDISADGQNTHVAAVAIETLEEAENFAVEHGFKPVSFVAAPGQEAFLGEPFFGTARVARGRLVQPDGVAVVEIGSVETIPIDALAEMELGQSRDGVTGKQNRDLEAELAPQAPAPSLSELDVVPPAEPPREPPLLSASLPPAPPRDRKEDPSAALPLGPETQIYAEEEDIDTVAAVGFSSRRSVPPTDNGTGTPSSDHKPRIALSVDGPNGATLPAAPSVGPIPNSAEHSHRNGSGTATTSLQTAPNAAARATSAPGKPQKNADKARATRIAPPTGFATTGPGAIARRGRTRVIVLGTAAAIGIAALGIGAWAALNKLPSLWSDLETADLVIEDDPLPPPVIASLPQDNSTQIALPTEEALETFTDGDQTLQSQSGADTSGRASSGPLPETDVGEATVSAITPAPVTPLQNGLIDTDAAQLPAPTVFDETRPLDGQELIIASLPSARETEFEQTPQDLTPSQLFSEENWGQETDVGLDPEALADGILPETIDGSDLAIAAQYAATGIWQEVPKIGTLPELIGINAVYFATIDHTDLSADAIALPTAPALDTDLQLAILTSPLDPANDFALDERGLVVASTDGTLNPDGILVYSGRPEPLPPAVPDRPDAAELAAEEEAQRLAALVGFRPRLRPANLEAVAETVVAGARPRLRPASLDITSAIASVVEESASEESAGQIVTGLRPRARPSNFANIVDRANRRQQATTNIAAAATPTSNQPVIPSSASVARQATERGAINLRRVNLLGIYGTSSDRRAMVRLPSGRLVKVKVGDRIDGGRIVAIGDTQLQYQKGGRNLTISLPSG